MYPILTPGEKAKKIRIELGASLEKISHPYSHSNLSRVEKNKIEMTEKMAKTIAININGIIKNEKDKITAKYLLETKEEQAIKIIKKLIEKLEFYNKINNKLECFLNVLNDLEEIYEEYNIELDLMFKAYILSSEFLFANYKYELSKEYAYKAMQIGTLLNDYEKKIKAFLFVSKNQHSLGQYTDAIYNIKYALSICKHYNVNDNVLLLKFNYNLASAYKEMNKHEKALKYLTVTDNLQNKLTKVEKIQIENLLSYSKTLRANIYRETNNLEDSKKIYKAILNQGNNDPATISRVYENLALVCLEENDLENAEKYIEIAINSKILKNYYETATQNYYALKINIGLGKEFKVISEYFEKALEYSEKSCTECLINSSIREMIQYCIHINKDNYVIYILHKIKPLYQQKHLSKNNMFDIFFICESYFKNDFEKIKKILDIKFNLIK